MSRLCVALAVASLGAAVGSSSAERLYSVDILTQRLCRIDPASGAIEIVGPITGFNGTVLDMDRPDATGDLASGGQLTVVVRTASPMAPAVSSCRCSLAMARRPSPAGSATRTRRCS